MTITVGRIYNITNKATGTFLDLSGSDNSSVIGYQNNGGHDNQRWLVNQEGEGFTFQNLRSFTYLTPSAYASSAHFTVGPVPTAFKVTPSGDGFVLGLPNSNFVVDLSGSSSANSTPVILYAAHGGANQTWVLTKVPPT